MTVETGTVRRQGDILFIARDSLPEGVKPIAVANVDRHVLAHGEATGHTHSILANRARLYVADAPGGGSRGGMEPNVVGVLELLDPGRNAPVEHQEHPPLPLDGGNKLWEVRRQEEWTDEQEPRQVAD